MNYRVNFKTAYSHLKRICSNLNLPDSVKDEANRLYLKALKKNLIHGRSVIGMVGACIYYASKAKFNRGLKEIAAEMEGSGSLSNVLVCRKHGFVVYQMSLKTHI